MSKCHKPWYTINKKACKKVLNKFIAMCCV